MQLWNKNFIKICLINLLVYLYPYMLISTFPFYIKSLGGSDMTVGLAAAMFSIAGMCVRPVAGYINDNYSRRLLMLLGISMITLISVGYALLPLLPLVLILRMLHGMSHSMLSTGIAVNACDCIPETRFSEGMGFYGMMTALPMALAPAMGLLIMERMGFKPLFFCLALLALFALITMLSFSYRRVEERRPWQWKNLFHKDAIPAALITYFAFMSYAGVSSFIALYAKENSLGSTGAYFLCWAFASMLMRFFFGRMGDKRGEMIPIVFANCCFIVGIFISVFATTPWLFALSGAVYGGGFGVFAPAVQAMSVRIVPPQERGAASSTYLLFCDLSGVSGGLISGALVTALGHRAMFLVMCLSAVCSVLIYLLWGRHTPSAFRQAGQAQTQASAE